jgi:heme/copper-type cytochrome/quinol oxidase subunit 3
MLYYKSHDGNEDDFWITAIVGLFILSDIFLFAALILALSLVNNSQPIKKDAESKYTVISSDGNKYSNLTKRFHNDSDFTTEQGKRIVFIGNHTTIEE